MVLKNWLAGVVAAGVLAASSALVFSQDKKQEQKEPTPEQMKAMMDAQQPGENHKMLEENMVGEWTYENKMWTGPEPEVSKGTCTTKSFYEGRFLHAAHTGTMHMPGPDGKPMDMKFEGTAVVGYDNVKKKFVSTWVDNMSTSITMFEGTYNPATKSITYTGEMLDCMNDNKPCKIREVVRVISKDKHILEWYQTTGGKEEKAMEITYTRKN